MLGPELAFRLFRLPRTSESTPIRDEDEFRTADLSWASYGGDAPLNATFERGLARAHVAYESADYEGAWAELQRLLPAVAEDDELRDDHSLASAEVLFALCRDDEAVRILDPFLAFELDPALWIRVACWQLDALKRMGRTDEAAELITRIDGNLRGLEPEPFIMEVITVAYFFAKRAEFGFVERYLRMLGRLALHSAGFEIKDVVAGVEILARSRIGHKDAHVWARRFLREWHDMDSGLNSQ